MLLPTYFAYGANMDVAAMARRCPASRLLGPARLMRHQFFIMSSGFASVRLRLGSAVYGVLWSLALADVPTLDRFEDVAGGLYRKSLHPVIRPGGSLRALVYVGRDTDAGPPRRGYFEAVIAAAVAAQCPASYVESLAAMASAGARGPVFTNDAAVEASPGGVRPRFATPYDRD